MTGLPQDVVANARGFVRGAYTRNLRAQGLHASSYDATFAVPDPFPEAENSRVGDPMLDGFPRALAGAFVGYARDELGFRTDMTYRMLNGEVTGRWEWGGGRSLPGISDDLRVLLSFDPSFRLMVVHGRSDLVTPYGVSRYLVDQLPNVTSDRVSFRAYRGGHMFYFDAEPRRAFTNDARDFFSAR